MDNYTATIYFPGNTQYNAISNVTKFKVTDKKQTSITVYVADITVGENATVFVEMNESVNDMVYVTIAGVAYDVMLENGKVNFTVSGLIARDYHVSAFFMGNEEYVMSNTTSDFTVHKKGTDLTVNATSVYVGEDVVIIANITNGTSVVVLFDINGTDYFAPIVDGVATLTVNNLAVGNYTVTAIFEGDSEHKGAISSATFTVTKRDTGIVIKGEDIIVGQTEVFTFETTANITEVVIIEVGGKNYTTFVQNGKGSFAVANLTADIYTATIYFSGNSKYAAISNYTTFIVSSKQPSQITVKVDNINVGENATIKVNVTPGATGDVTIVIKGTEYTETLNNSEATFIIPDLIARDYEVTAIYAGDSNYLASDAKANFTVNKIDPNMNATAGDVIVGHDVNVVVELPTDINNTYVVIKIGEDYYGALVNDGVAKLAVSNLAIGNYTGTVIYSGNDKYHNDTAEFTFAVTEDIKVTVNSTTGNVTDVVVEVPNNGTGNVTIFVDGKEFNGTVVNGTGNVNLTAVTPGIYNVTVVFDDGNGTVIETNTTIEIPKWESAMDVNVTENINVGDVARIDVALIPGATGLVLVEVDGKGYYVNVTDGNATLEVPGLSAGEYPVSITYLGDDLYEGTTESATIKVNKAEPPMDVGVENVTFDGADIVVTLPEDAEGNITVIIDGDKEITVPVNGSKTTIPIDNLTSGEHNITVIYGGDDKYANKTMNTTVKPIESIATVIVVDSNFYRYANDYNAGERGDYFYATLYDINGNVLANKTVQIAINGPIYTVITDENGRAGLPINLAVANTYTYALFFQGDEHYNASLIASSKLTLVKKPTSIIANNKYSFKASDATKTVTVALNTIKNPYDGKMYLTKGKTLTLTVNGKTYSAKADSNGVAKFNIKLDKKGTYDATVSFAGDKTYDSVSKKIKIVIGDSTSNDVLIGVGSGFDAGPLPEDGPINIEGNYSDYVTNSGISTGNLVPTKKYTVIVADETFTRVANDYNAGERGDYFYATLKDTDGNLLVNKSVQIAVNGPIYNVTTDDQGRAAIMINLARANTYTYALTFSGDDEYNPAPIASSKLIVTKKSMEIIASNQVFNADDKTKTVHVTLKTSPNPYDGKTYMKSNMKVTLKVNGKTYTGYSDDKGVVKFNINLSTKGTYSASISYDGDATYEAASKTISIKIK